jgi:hypothetical protein
METRHDECVQLDAAATLDWRQLPPQRLRVMPENSNSNDRARHWHLRLGLTAQYNVGWHRMMIALGMLFANSVKPKRRADL